MAMQRSPLLMSKILDRGAKGQPGEEIVTATAIGTRRQTNLETRNRAHQLAHTLRDAGIAIGDRVGTFMWNGSRHLEAYHAAAGMGAVLHTLNIRLFPEQITFIVNHAEDAVIFVDDVHVGTLEPLAKEFRSVRAFVVMGDGPLPATSLQPAYRYEDLLAAASNLAIPEWDPESGLVVLHPTRPLAVGAHTLRLRAEDRLGNGSERTWNFTVPAPRARRKGDRP